MTGLAFYDKNVWGAWFIATRFTRAYNRSTVQEDCVRAPNQAEEFGAQVWSTHKAYGHSTDALLKRLQAAAGISGSMLL
jgi:hypothetical protein